MSNKVKNYPTVIKIKTIYFNRIPIRSCYVHNCIEKNLNLYVHVEPLKRVLCLSPSFLSSSIIMRKEVFNYYTDDKMFLYYYPIPKESDDFQGKLF